MRTWRVIQHVRSSLWFVPVVCVLAGAALSFGTIAVDRQSDYQLVPDTLTGGPDAAIAILTTVATSMLSLTALVLTITMVVVQLAMGQFSPRIVQTILRDKPSQLAIGLFVATFAHAMLAMREVRFEGEGEGTVPGLAIVVAYVLVVICIVVLVLYVHHIGRSLRVSKLIELVGEDTRRIVDRDLAEHGPPAPAPERRAIVADHSGVVVHLDIERLVEYAERAGTVLRLVPALGDFVPAGAPLVELDDEAPLLADDEVRGAIVLALERTLDQDLAYGFRMLVDIAERSLSDSRFQDPTTAVQAIDRLHDCLRQMARRPLPSGRFTDGDGVVRLVVPTMDWDAYVHLAFDEVRLAGGRSPQIARRLVSALTDLRSVTLPERVPALDRQLRLLADDIRRGADEGAVDDPELLLAGDRQGLGRSAASAQPAGRA